MISISGIRYQKELENLPYFNKYTAGVLIGKKGRNLDKKIEQLIKKGYLLSLKNGLYVSSVFVDRTDKSNYQEYIANILRYPSYLSLEYVLSIYGLIPEGVYALTSVTLKSSRVFNNFLGTFIYRNIKPELFYGFIEKDFNDKKIKMATVAKALFDFLYFKKLERINKAVIEDLRINFDNFKSKDSQEFSRYVLKSKSKKMAKILKIFKEFYDY